MPAARRDLKEAQVQNTDPTNRNRIQGRRGGVTRLWTGTPDSHPDTRAGKSGGDRVKETRLTLGGLRLSRTKRVASGRPDAKEAEESAEAIVAAQAVKGRIPKGKAVNVAPHSTQEPRQEP